MLRSFVLPLVILYLALAKVGLGAFTWEGVAEKSADQYKEADLNNSNVNRPFWSMQLSSKLTKTVERKKVIFKMGITI